MSKIIEKLIINKLSLYCENYSKLHLGQIGSRKEKSTINIITTLIHIVYIKWEEKKLVAALFIDVKGAFDYVSKGHLFNRITELNIHGDLVNWIGFF